MKTIAALIVGFIMGMASLSIAVDAPFPPWIKLISGDISISDKGVVSFTDSNSHYIFAAGEFTTAGGDTDETISVSGALASDICIVSLHTAGAVPVTVIDAACGADDIDVDMSADPSTDHVLSYIVMRPDS
jgi:hypothetical protein